MKLLIPGWAGEVTDIEAAYIAGELKKDSVLRQKWQTRKFTRYWRQITPAIVKRMAAAWAENDTSGDEGLATASAPKDNGGGG
jgi:hypothetical protein